MSLPLMISMGGAGPDSAARTDTKLALVYNSVWFRFPYPCEYMTTTTEITSYEYIEHQWDWTKPRSYSRFHIRELWSIKKNVIRMRVLRRSGSGLKIS